MRIPESEALQRFLGIFIICIFTSPAFAGVPLKVSTIRTQPLTIIKGSHTESGQTHGVTKARDFLAKCDVDMELVVMPSWSRAYNLAVSGRVDALMPTNYSKAREKDFFFPRHAFSSMAIVVFSHKENTVNRYTGPELFKGKKLGRLKGSLLTKEIDDYAAANNVTNIERATMESLFEALVQRKIDYAADQMFLNKADLAALEVDTWVKALMPPAGETPLYIAFSRKGSLAAPENAAVLKCLTM